MMKSFNYFQSTRIVFGAGTIEQAGDLVKEYGKKVLLVTTRYEGGLQNQYDRIMGIMASSRLQVFHFDGIIPNPTTKEITMGAEMAMEHQVDVIVGFGGGSSMDAAKAIAVEASHEGTSWDYLFYKDQPTDSTLPIVAIGTTSGTGSQVTQVSVVTNSSGKDKSALYNELLYPKLCIIDPELMTSLPDYVTATTGFDVLCHAFESLLHPGKGEYVEMMAQKAIGEVCQTLPKVLDDPGNVELRSALAWADTLAGLCIANSGVTMPHGIAMAISGLYPHISHGQALASIYVACASYTWESSIAEHAFLADNLLKSVNGKTNQDLAERSSDEIAQFLGKIGLDKSLGSLNMPKEEVDLLADRSMVLPDYKNNPRVASKEDMVEIVQHSY